MTGTVIDPKWNLERRGSSGQLVWCKDSPRSKVRFRFDVEVLEYEKDNNEDINVQFDGGSSIGSVASTVVLCATCVVAVAASMFLPWYLLDKAASF